MQPSRILRKGDSEGDGGGGNSSRPAKIGDRATERADGVDAAVAVDAVAAARTAAADDEPRSESAETACEPVRMPRPSQESRPECPRAVRISALSGYTPIVLPGESISKYRNLSAPAVPVEEPARGRTEPPLSRKPQRLRRSRNLFPRSSQSR